jgi:hypothetical protein
MGKEIKLSKSYIIKEIKIDGLNVKIEVISDNFELPFYSKLAIQ